TSVLASVAVPAIREAISKTQAQKVYVCNLRPEEPETTGYDLAAHVAALEAHGITADAVLWDPANMALGGGPSTDLAGLLDVRKADLARPDGAAHDPLKLATALRDLLV